MATKKWLIKIPYEGTAVIPIVRDEEPKDMNDSEISNKLHTGYLSEGMPRYFRNKGKIEEETSDQVFNSYLKDAEKQFKKKSSITNELDTLASDLESQGQPLIALAIDKISDYIEGTSKEIICSACKEAFNWSGPVNAVKCLKCGASGKYGRTKM